MKKRTLVTKISTDCSLVTNEQIERFKKYLKEAFDGEQIEFEIVEEELSSTEFMGFMQKRIEAAVQAKLDQIEALSKPSAEPDASEEQPMQTVELDESQSKVLRGFFAGSDEPG